MLLLANVPSSMKKLQVFAPHFVFTKTELDEMKEVLLENYNLEECFIRTDHNYESFKDVIERNRYLKKQQRFFKTKSTSQ